MNEFFTGNVDIKQLNQILPGSEIREKTYDELIRVHRHLYRGQVDPETMDKVTRLECEQYLLHYKYFGTVFPNSDLGSSKTKLGKTKDGRLYRKIHCEFVTELKKIINPWKLMTPKP